MLTDAARRRAVPTCRRLPMLVVDDPRAVLGDRRLARVRRPDPAADHVIGITGTAGKTSTAYLIEAGLRAAGQVTGLIGTVETRLGDLTIDSARTTPEATDLHALFAAGLERGVEAVVMEVSSHALELGRVDGVRFAAAGYTNFGMDHLDFHPDVEAYYAAKARLFDGRAATEILNLDDAQVMRLRKPGRRGPTRRPATPSPTSAPPASRPTATGSASPPPAPTHRRRRRRGPARPAQRRQRAARDRRPRRRRGRHRRRREGRRAGTRLARPDGAGRRPR